MPNTRTLLESYVQAKDRNRPYQLVRVFTPDVQLTMNVLTSEIDFPSQAHGLKAASEIVCGQLNQRFENISTFYFTDPPVEDDDRFECGWMVVMSEKAGGSVRVGGGHYLWTFNSTKTLASSFVITVKCMASLPGKQLSEVMTWAEQLNYPWVSHSLAEMSARKIEGLPEILYKLKP